MDNLVGFLPADILLHGPSKRYVNNFLWHSPQEGIVGSYTPDAKDVQDHFGVFRGVDMIESFAQVTIAACVSFLEYKKRGGTIAELKDRYIPTFISVGQVNFHHYVMEGETFFCVGFIKFYKFRQMVADGRIYKVPNGFNLENYFKDFSLEDLKNYNFDKEFTLVAEIFDITGRAIKK